ncbi:MAG: sarcosine oxidase subunit gamma family protein [Candidatus Dormibacteraeota bacterium]|nr:sarcosine oxidase subunit gamma family protein [Candidatus Dormibacteraeota bacterium]
MIAEATRRSPLANYADRFAALSDVNQGNLTIREIPFLTQINFRANPSAADLVAGVQQQLGFTLPTEPNTVATKGDRSCLWLGPDEWLVVGPPDQQRSIEAALRSALGDHPGAVVDVSANRTVIEVKGTSARDLLAHGCAIDLHPRAFGPGRCAQTLLAKAYVIVQQKTTTPAFHIYVRSSFANYLADWLLDGAEVPRRGST